MDEQAKQARRDDAAERLRQALAQLAKARAHAGTSQDKEGRGTAAGQSAPSGQ